MNKLVHKEMNKLIDICHINLKSSEQCLSYLQETRGLTWKDISKFKLGYFPQNTRKLTDYVSQDVLRSQSILDYSGSSKFCDFFYLIFPIFSEYEEAIAIGGRTLLSDDNRALYNLPKYQNSSFKKSRYLYGLNQAKEDIVYTQNVFVVEGYFDLIALNSRGIKNTVAVCGTAFSKNHLLKLARYTDKITFILDRDDAGKKSMERIYHKFCNHGIKLRFMLLPEQYKDADEYFTVNPNSKTFISDLELFVPNW